jgi:hypothetical protein
MTNFLLKREIQDEKKKEIKETPTDRQRDKKEIESQTDRETEIDIQRDRYIERERDRRERERQREGGESEREKERLIFSVFPESGNTFLGIKFPSQNSGRKNFSSRFRSRKREPKNYGACCTQVWL